MINHGRVRSTIRPEAKEIDAYSVWVNTDIEEVTVTSEDACTEYEFTQVQYTKDEYIKMIDDKNSKLETQLTDTQLALVNVYEMII